MKTLAKISLALISGISFIHAMDEDGWASIYQSIAAFENRADQSVCPGCFNRPGYVKPIVDNLGNILNSNWYVSANVPQSFTFEAGLPFSLIPIGNDDQVFNENGAEVPTIFGTHGDPVTNPFDQTVYGNETLNSLGVFTYPYLQMAAGFYHARIALRGMWLPSISELKKFNLLGFGLQYSFGHLFQYMLPPAAQGLDVSLAFGYSSSGIGYQPEDYTGELDLDITALTFDVVIGYKPFNFIELMMTLGYQYANMESSGSVTCMAIDANGTYNAYYGQTINPNISVKGNNGFKFGLAVAFQLGSSFHPVVGFDYAGKSSFTTNILYFKQQFGKDKTPDEIAKEKGYVRGASKKADDETASEPTAEPENENVTEPADSAIDENAEPAAEESSDTEESNDEATEEE